MWNYLCVISKYLPFRPKWNVGMSAEELLNAEREHFLNWRRDLAMLQENEGMILTPYEKNLEFWRQLWRVVDRRYKTVTILIMLTMDFVSVNLPFWIQIQFYYEFWMIANLVLQLKHFIRLTTSGLFLDSFVLDHVTPGTMHIEIYRF